MESDLPARARRSITQRSSGGRHRGGGSRPWSAGGNATSHRTGWTKRGAPPVLGTEDGETRPRGEVGPPNFARARAARVRPRPPPSPNTLSAISPRRKGSRGPRDGDRAQSKSHDQTDKRRTSSSGAQQTNPDGRAALIRRLGTVLERRKKARVGWIRGLLVKDPNLEPGALNSAGVEALPTCRSNGQRAGPRDHDIRQSPPPLDRSNQVRTAVVCATQTPPWPRQRGSPRGTPESAADVCRRFDMQWNDSPRCGLQYCPRNPMFEMAPSGPGAVKPDRQHRADAPGPCLKPAMIASRDSGLGVRGLRASLKDDAMRPRRPSSRNRLPERSAGGRRGPRPFADGFLASGVIWPTSPG